VTVLDASVAVKWFVDGEPLADEARSILLAIQDDPRDFVVPELFMNEVLAVLARMPGATTEQVAESLDLLADLGLHRVPTATICSQPRPVSPWTGECPATTQPTLSWRT
jgi:predicted nucleic acid-binding protein